MNRSLLVWGLPGTLYALFFFWYTSFGGPLTTDEIERYVSLLQEQRVGEEQRVGGGELARLRRFLEADTGDDFVMVNAIEMRETPELLPGVLPGESSAEVLDRYMAYMWPALLTRACHPVLFGAAAADALEVWGIDNARAWGQAGLMRYRSRRDLMDIATNPAFRGPHEFKIAAMAKTIAFPVDPWMQAGDPRLILAMALLILALVADRFARPRP